MTQEQSIISGKAQNQSNYHAAIEGNLVLQSLWMYGNSTVACITTSTPQNRQQSSFNS